MRQKIDGKSGVASSYAPKNLAKQTSLHTFADSRQS